MTLWTNLDQLQPALDIINFVSQTPDLFLIVFVSSDSIVPEERYPVI